MSELNKLREDWYRRIDVSLPSWALEQEWNILVKNHVDSKTKPLCESCDSILGKREKIHKNLK